MFELLIEWARQEGFQPGFLRLLDYVTFRALAGMATALLVSLLLGHRFILALYRWGIRDTSGDFRAIDASNKAGTPQAGGLLIVAATSLSVLLWADLDNRMVQVCLAGFLYLGGVGFVDDFRKSRFKTALAGLSQRGKSILLLLFLLPFGLFFVSAANPVPEALRTALVLPFVKVPLADLGAVATCAFIVFALYSIINAVNMADGLDGLLGGLSIVTLAVYAVFAYIIGNAVLSAHFLFPHVPATSELTVFAAALAGAVLGFLWYNVYPAEVFMGDTGSLAIGGAIGMMAFFTRQEWLFPIVGGVFVLEIATAFLQDKVANWPLVGRRILHRAPFHHQLTHFGIAEPKAVFRLLIVAMLLAVVALASIKIR